MSSDKMINVTRDEFYKYVNPRDIVLSSGPQVTKWTTRYGSLIGETEGYKITADVGDPYYKLIESALREINSNEA